MRAPIARGLGGRPCRRVSVARVGLLVSILLSGLGTGVATAAVPVTVVRAGAGRQIVAAASSGAGSGRVTGTVANISGLTVRVTVTGAGRGALSTMLATAERIATKNYPYVYGGGHAHAGSASRGSSGHAVGYDCSGAVAAVLAAGGLWPHGGAVPSDTGIIAELRDRGLVANGPGRGPDEVTLYDVPGHIIMSLAGLPWGTGANARGGAGFLPGAMSGRHVTVVHVKRVRQSGLPDQLGLTAPQTNAGSLTLDGLSDGVSILAGYRTGQNGSLTLGSVSFPGGVTVSGVLAGFSDGGAQLRLLPATGPALTLSVPARPGSQVFTGPSGAPSGPPSLDTGVYVGQTLSVTYTHGVHGSLVLRRRRVVSTPPQLSMTGILTGQSPSAGTLSVEDDTDNTVTTFTLPPGQGGDFSGISNGCALTVSYYASVDGLPPALLSARFLDHWTAPSGFKPAPGITAYGACFH